MVPMPSQQAHRVSRAPLVSRPKAVLNYFQAHRHPDMITCSDTLGGQVKPTAFDYHAATSTDEAVGLLSELVGDVEVRSHRRPLSEAASRAGDLS
jgi:hypothetical protein